MTKPAASRSTSAEIYAIGLRYKAPAKIDPRLLDVKHLFQGAIEPPKASGHTSHLSFILYALDKHSLILDWPLNRWWMF